MSAMSSMSSMSAMSALPAVSTTTATNVPTPTVDVTNQSGTSLETSTQVSEPAAKRQKVVPKKRLLMISDVHMSDTHLQPLVKSSKCLLVPLVYTVDKKSPVLIQLSGGGLIPLSFGIDDTEVEGRRKVRMAFQIEDKSDHAHLDRLRKELSDVVVEMWPSWYPDTKAPSAEVLHTLCNTLVSARKKKTNSEDTWSGVSKAVIDPDDCLSGKCKIVDRETGDKVPFDILPGMTWHKIILEFRYIYIQATKSYGITKKLRYLSCSAADEEAEMEPL